MNVNSFIFLKSNGGATLATRIHDNNGGANSALRNGTLIAPTLISTNGELLADIALTVRRGSSGRFHHSDLPAGNGVILSVRRCEFSCCLLPLSRCHPHTPINLPTREGELPALISVNALGQWRRRIHAI